MKYNTVRGHMRLQGRQWAVWGEGVRERGRNRGGRRGVVVKKNVKVMISCLFFFSTGRFLKANKSTKKLSN